MVEQDYASCRIPVLMAQAIDKFLETNIAKKNGITSRNDFVTRVVAGWFARYEKDYDLFVPREIGRVGNTKHEHLKPFD